LTPSDVESESADFRAATIPLEVSPPFLKRRRISWKRFQ
jgi:hypothetical protein